MFPELPLKYKFNPYEKVPVDTIIESAVPYKSLPGAPRGYEWYLEKYVITRRYKTKKYVYAVRRRRRERRYIWRMVTHTEKWWTLRKHFIPKLRGKFVPADDFYRAKLDNLDIDYDDVEHEKQLPFDYVEKDTGFNYYKKTMPAERTYNMLFLYYIFSVYRGVENRLIHTYSTFDLKGEYTLNDIIKNKLSQAVEITAERMENKGKKSGMRFVSYTGFSVTSARELEAGKR